jgi:hypothetical protein
MNIAPAQASNEARIWSLVEQSAPREPPVKWVRLCPSRSGRLRMRTP